MVQPNYFHICISAKLFFPYIDYISHTHSRVWLCDLEKCSRLVIKISGRASIPSSFAVTAYVYVCVRQGPYIVALLPSCGLTESAATTASASLHQVRLGARTPYAAFARVYRLRRRAWKLELHARDASFETSEWRRSTSFFFPRVLRLLRNIAKTGKSERKKFIYNKYNLRIYRMTYVSKISSATPEW